MAKILLIQPNRWGRGITSIWIPSHAGILKSRNHDVKLFECTFYKNWTENELDFNTQNQQYQPTEYSKYLEEHYKGFVIKEDEFKVPLESPFYGTVFVGLRYGQQSKKLEVYFSYFIDCLKNPHVVAKQTYSLTESHM